MFTEQNSEKVFRQCWYFSNLGYFSKSAFTVVGRMSPTKMLRGNAKLISACRPILKCECFWIWWPTDTADFAHHWFTGRRRKC